MKKIIRKIIWGTTLNQEYICLPCNIVAHLSSVFLAKDGDRTADVNISDKHLFLGYKPVLIALRSVDVKNFNGGLLIRFSQNNCLLGTINVLPVRNAEYNWPEIILCQAIQGKSHLLPFPSIILSRLYDRLRYKKQGNISLPGNLYTQVKIAYSYPRKICLASLHENDLYNVFPTDLHGKIGGSKYYISLRTKGKACRQVLNLKQISLCEIEASSYRQAYGMGPNHMKNLRPASEFDYQSQYSSRYGNLLLPSVISYLELSLLDSVQVGIHTILKFDVVDSFQVKKGEPLMHIHRDYAAWREKNNIESKFLLR